MIRGTAAASCLALRGQGVPGWIRRYLYRPLIRPTAAYFERAMREYASRENRHGVLD